MIYKILCFIFATEMILYTSFGPVFFVKSQETNGHSAFSTNVTVRLSVQNKISPTTCPPYDATYLVSDVTSGSTLFQVMTAASSLGFTFNFTINPAFGAFITTVNGLEADASLNQYWALIDGLTGAFLQLGTSCYQPKNGDNIVFQLALF